VVEVGSCLELDKHVDVTICTHLTPGNRPEYSGMTHPSPAKLGFVQKGVTRVRVEPLAVAAAL